jgi:hypothetical protein
MAQRVAILWHERQRPDSVADYAIDWYARTWRSDGVDVAHVFGVDGAVAADVVIVHVDLSVVPDAYLDFAARYPASLNRGLVDIRKSTYSGLQLTRSSDYGGRVIVKTIRNHGGRPERRLSKLAPLRQGPARWRRRRTTQWNRSRSPYRIYDHLAGVPRHFFADPRYIVERLMTEECDGLFWTRYLNVLGPRVNAYRISGPTPIVTGVQDVQSIEVDPSVLEYARRIGLEYGKIDYVVHEGETFILDVNKTTGAGRPPHNEIFLAGRRNRQRGIYDFLPGTTGTAAAPIPLAQSSRGS